MAAKTKGKSNSDDIPIRLLINKGGWTMKLSQFSLNSLSQAGVKKICAPKLLKCLPGTAPPPKPQPPAPSQGIPKGVVTMQPPLPEPPPSPLPAVIDTNMHYTQMTQIEPSHVALVEECQTQLPKPSLTKVTPIPKNPSNKKYICPKCKEEFPSRKMLAAHKKTHPRLFSCEHCKAEFKSAKAVELHMRAHTGERPYHCGICNKWFRRRDYLKAHREIHTGARPHICTECNVSFRLRSSLIRHARLHSGERPYKCDFCNESFTNKHVLKIHTSSHTGERPYLCGHCGMSFIVSTNLKRHVMIHTGEKPHVCAECGERFIQQHHLTQHMLKHSGDTPFSCVECNTHFKFHSSLNNHIKSVHKGIPLVKRRRTKPFQNRNVVVVQADVQLTNEQQAVTLDLLNNIMKNDGNHEWKLSETSSSKDIETAVAIAQAVSSIGGTQVVSSHSQQVLNQGISIPQIQHSNIPQQGTIVQTIQPQQQGELHCPPGHAIVIHQTHVPQATGHPQIQDGKEQDQATYLRANMQNRSDVLILPFHRHFELQHHSVGMW